MAVIFLSLRFALRTSININQKANIPLCRFKRRKHQQRLGSIFTRTYCSNLCYGYGCCLKARSRSSLCWTKIKFSTRAEGKKNTIDEAERKTDVVTDMTAHMEKVAKCDTFWRKPRPFLHDCHWLADRKLILNRTLRLEVYFPLYVSRKWPWQCTAGQIMYSAQNVYITCWADSSV